MQKKDGLPADVHGVRTLIANVVMIGEPDTSEWTLIDAGVVGCADVIVEAAASLYGETPPRAIVLTHGHFDHVGSLRPLLARWRVPVYAHAMELPYLTGEADYPEADPDVGGGLMARISPLYPHKGIDISGDVRPLPEDGTVPTLPEWRWIHTPGHSEGHISLFRERDRTVVAGDAFITVKQTSAFAVLLQEEEIHGPPPYFTFGWRHAAESVRKLEALKPAAAITGHGKPMAGEALTEGLAELARSFEELAVPHR